ncbi:N-acetyltransferase [Leucobacter sp. cx-42]|uniref:GNAT family N-acetyltransferase n=1 Tax=unclassified Leucobacter TaxID=2621730 RepID=UPI00165EA309|nr:MULTISPECIES: GNAT family N-acetyltransferase [unclassified Leucobacter]MBC9953058.1 N-acetyltransferase [Leucobacter sp. cx-42]
MARYLTEEAAAADGFTIVHEPAKSEFALYSTDGAKTRKLGEAHYSLAGEAGTPNATIDFDHTFVDPQLRGTGLSGLLAHVAVSSEIAADRRTLASCWFIDGYLKKHPEYRRA